MKNRNNCVKITVLIFICLVLSSCVSDDKMEAGKKTAMLLGVDEFYVGVEQENLDGYVTTFRIVNFSDSGKGLLMDQVASFAAFNLVQNAKPGVFRRDEMVKVTINNDTGKFEKAYRRNEINLAGDHFKSTKRFLENYANANDTFMSMDTAYIPPADVVEFFVMEKGKANDAEVVYQFAGFKTARLEIDETPVVVIWINRFSKNETFRYTFVINTKNKKFVQIGIDKIKNGYVKWSI